MRLLNCFSYVLFVTYSIITESSSEKSSFNVEKEIRNQELKKEARMVSTCNSTDTSSVSDSDLSSTRSPAKVQKLE